MLEVVEQEQQTSTPEERLELFEQPDVPLLTQVKCMCDGTPDQVRIGDRRQRNEAHTVPELRGSICSQLEGQPGLAYPAWTRQRKEPDRRCLKQLGDTRELTFAPDQGRKRRWQTGDGTNLHGDLSPKEGPVEPSSLHRPSSGQRSGRWLRRAPTRRG